MTSDFPYRSAIRKRLPPQVKSFLVVAVATSLTTWDLSFNLGAFGVIFFSKIFTAWVIASATFLGCLLLPEHQTPVERRGLAIMAVPTVGFLFTALSTNFSMPIFWRVIDFISAATAYIVCLPYTIFVIFSITQSELVSLSKLLVRKLIVITLIIGILGYFVGSQNHLFLTCDDFKVSGSDLPANCRQVKGSPLKSETKTGEAFLSKPSSP